MKFERDDKKARANIAKHGVAFHEAASILGDSLALTFRDPDRSARESRFITFGESIGGRLLVVVHTARGAIIRIISARPATRQERKIYEEG